MQNNVKNTYTQEDIENALRQIGLVKGDHIFTHSNVGFFGILEGAETENDYYRIFKAAIFNVIGSEGTMIMPTFTYSYCWKKFYNKKTSPSECGLLPEMMRLDPEAFRSDDANFSIVAIGNLAEYFIRNPPINSFGPDSFWERFLMKNGKIVNFNFDSASTFFHYVERVLKVPYRWDKKFPGISIIDGKEVKGEYYHFVYDLEKPNHVPEFTKFHKRAEELGYVKKVNLGRGQIISITARDTFDLIKKELKTNPSFLIVGPL